MQRMISGLQDIGGCAHTKVLHVEAVEWGVKGDEACVCWVYEMGYNAARK